MDNISSDQIAYRKRIGTLGGDAVIELATKGGLHLVVTAHNGRVETLGTGPHRAVARHIAKKLKPDIKWTDLSKSDHIEEIHFAHCLSKYEAITQAFRDAEGSE